MPDLYKERLLLLSDQRISKDGVVIIKAQRYRTQEKNRDDALVRLRDLIHSVMVTPKKRTPTRPTLGSRKRRLDSKTRHSPIGDMQAAGVVDLGNPIRSKRSILITLFSNSALLCHHLRALAATDAATCGGAPIATNSRFTVLPRFQCHLAIKVGQ